MNAAVLYPPHRSTMSPMTNETLQRNIGERGAKWAEGGGRRRANEGETDGMYTLGREVGSEYV